jgi:hypothetical protein
MIENSEIFRNISAHVELCFSCAHKKNFRKFYFLLKCFSIFRYISEFDKLIKKDCLATSERQCVLILQNRVKRSGQIGVQGKGFTVLNSFFSSSFCQRLCKPFKVGSNETIWWQEKSFDRSSQ